MSAGASTRPGGFPGLGCEHGWERSEPLGLVWLGPGTGPAVRDGGRGAAVGDSPVRRRQPPPRSGARSMAVIWPTKYDPTTVRRQKQMLSDGHELKFSVPRHIRRGRGASRGVNGGRGATLVSRCDFNGPANLSPNIPHYHISIYIARDPICDGIVYRHVARRRDLGSVVIREHRSPYQRRADSRAFLKRSGRSVPDNPQHDYPFGVQTRGGRGSYR